VRKLLIALLLVGLFQCPAASDCLIVPDGVLAPDGGLNYTIPGGLPAVAGNQMLGECQRPSSGVNQGSAPHLLRGQPYPVSYPMLWVPNWVSPDTVNRWPNVRQQSQ
jgi:hypothetical protein